MEESLRKLKDMFCLEDTDIRTYSPLTLAYIGDAIYELVIRTILVEKGNTQVNKLHNRASRLVKASAQSSICLLYTSIRWMSLSWQRKSRSRNFIF